MLKALIPISDPVGSFGSELQRKLSSKHSKDDTPQYGHKFLRPAPTYKPHTSTAHNSSQSSNLQSIGPLTKTHCGSSQSLRDSNYGHGSDEVERSSSKSSLSGQEGSGAGRHNRFPLAPTPSLSCYDMSNSREPPTKIVSRSISMVQKPLCPPPPLPKPPNDGRFETCLQFLLFFILVPMIIDLNAVMLTNFASCDFCIASNT